ncbi:MAG: biopolymer transporter ExbD [Fibrobacterales bacterium]
MKRRNRPQRANQELNITNLVDVVFAILVVFMITAPLMTQGVKVDLPKAEAPALENKDLLRVSIDKFRNLYIGRDMVTKKTFNEMFIKIWDKESAVLINSDAKVSYGEVMKIVTRVQNLGVTKLGFLTDGKPQK